MFTFLLICIFIIMSHIINRSFSHVLAIMTTVNTTHMFYLPFLKIYCAFSSLVSVLIEYVTFRFSVMQWCLCLWRSDWSERHIHIVIVLAGSDSGVCSHFAVSQSRISPLFSVQQFYFTCAFYSLYKCICNVCVL